jgi:hypothetical protein
MQKMDIPTVSQKVYDEIDRLIRVHTKEPHPKTGADINDLMYAAGAVMALRQLRTRLERTPHDAR